MNVMSGWKLDAHVLDIIDAYRGLSARPPQCKSWSALNATDCTTTTIVNFSTALKELIWSFLL